MKRNFIDDSFEEFLRQSADGLRMYPSDRVWKNISKHLNQKRGRRGPAIGFFLLALSMCAYFTLDTLSYSHKLDSFVARVLSISSHTDNQKGSPIARKNVSATFPLPNDHQPRNAKASESPSEIDAEHHLQNTSSDIVHEKHITDVTSTVTPFSPATNALLLPDFEENKSSFIPSKKKKTIWQFYFTPTVSYRKLTENKSFLRSQSPVNPGYWRALIFNVDNVVTHKPELGFETGMAARFRLSQTTKLRGGIQFNINRYNIKAYNAGSEATTIMLNARRNNSNDSLVAYSRYSNNAGYKTDWLQNLYVQISAPIGVELQLAGNEKVQLGIATTVQPTYVLGDRAYLISTDYKNYAEVPQLIRRWNVNTAFETFVGYSTGHLNWQVGPQVRYQLLSSFVDKYPVKENLFDFGLKVGISVNK